MAGDGFDPFSQVRRSREQVEGEAGAPDWEHQYGQKLQSLRDQFAKKQDVARAALGAAQGLRALFGSGQVPRSGSAAPNPVRQGGMAGVNLGSGQSNDPKSLAQQMAAGRGWTGAEWDALVDLVQRESGWNPNAQNPTSSAYGLFQFLDSTRANYGITRDASLQQQIDAGLRYIADRYKTPSGALAHWLARKPINGRDVGNWY